MAKILLISSEVVRGHVGASAGRFVLQRLGHQVWTLPTIVLSNHPGHKVSAQRVIAPGDLKTMFDALNANGWLGEVDALLTGYLPSAEHVAFAASAYHALLARRPDLIYLCDPALGDHPMGLYIDQHAAAAVRDDLIPLADIVTPNTFELDYLASGNLGDLSQPPALTGTGRPGTVVATSMAANGADDQLANLLITQQGVVRCCVPKQSRAPHGTGDMFAALYLGALLNGRRPDACLAFASAAVQQALQASRGHDELQLVASQDDWASAPLLPVEQL